MVNCGFCGHPDVHAVVMPPSGASTGRCPACPYCQAEVAEEAAKPADGDDSAEGDESA